MSNTLPYKEYVLPSAHYGWLCLDFLWSYQGLVTRWSRLGKYIHEIWMTSSHNALHISDSMTSHRFKNTLLPAGHIT